MASNHEPDECRDSAVRGRTPRTPDFAADRGEARYRASQVLKIDRETGFLSGKPNGSMTIPPCNRQPCRLAFNTLARSIRCARKRPFDRTRGRLAMSEAPPLSPEISQRFPVHSVALSQGRPCRTDQSQRLRQSSTSFRADGESILGFARHPLCQTRRPIYDDIHLQIMRTRLKTMIFGPLAPVGLASQRGIH